MSDGSSFLESYFFSFIIIYRADRADYSGFIKVSHASMFLYQEFLLKEVYIIEIYRQNIVKLQGH